MQKVLSGVGVNKECMEIFDQLQRGEITREEMDSRLYRMAVAREDFEKTYAPREVPELPPEPSRPLHPGRRATKDELQAYKEEMATYSEELKSLRSTWARKRQSALDANRSHLAWLKKAWDYFLEATKDGQNRELVPLGEKVVKVLTMYGEKGERLGEQKQESCPF